jgi:hypothetical protein
MDRKGNADRRTTPKPEVDSVPPRGSADPEGGKGQGHGKPNKPGGKRSRKPKDDEEDG